jgi:hypothetical protein
LLDGCCSTLGIRFATRMNAAERAAGSNFLANSREFAKTDSGVDRRTRSPATSAKADNGKSKRTRIDLRDMTRQQCSNVATVRRARKMRLRSIK